MGTKRVGHAAKSHSAHPIPAKQVSMAQSSLKMPIRKRRCTTKTRTGCLTCKARRVRCDEHKPQCWNCLKSRDRVCRGYEQPLPARSSKSEQPSPSDSTAGSSSTTASASSSSNTSASTTPIGFHAPKSFATQLAVASWSYTPSTDWPGQEATSYFPTDLPAAPVPQLRSASISAPIINYPTLPHRRHGSTPGDNSSSFDGSQSPRGLSQDSVWDYREGRRSMPVVLGPLPSSDQHLSPLPDPEMLQRRHSQPSLEMDSLSLAAHRPSPSPFTLTPVISPLISNPSTARSFDFYLRHSGAAMGARSSPSFFLCTVPQIASHSTHVRYALLAVALVDSSVNDDATDNGKYGPGIECVDHEARRASFVMYNRAIRALVEAKDDSTLLANAKVLDNLHRRELDDSLAAILITCLLLFSFEYWLWNYQNAARHLDGALGLMQSYERSMEGKPRRPGLLEEKVLPMMRQATRFHTMSIEKGIPASKFGEGATWAPGVSEQVAAV